MSKLTVQHIKEKKSRNEKIVMLTAYDYPLARLIDQAGVDIALVGDSVANVVLGLEETKEMTMDQMIYHAKAVSRGIASCLLVGDMPYHSYQLKPSEAVSQAKRFIDEAGCDAVKLEWFDQCLDVARSLVDAGIDVMGHVGLTPQTAEELGGFKVQGKDVASAKRIIDHAKELENCGCFSIVLECIPAPIAGIITGELSIPTIGIGAGVHCDGQVLVTHDLLGLFDRFRPKFAKQYVNVNELIKSGLSEFANDVRSSKFPSDAQSFHMKEDELKKLEVESP